MIDRANLTVTSREQLRREIARQTETFAPRVAPARPVGPVWWDTRGSGPLMMGF
jgi:hypothetical protein